MKKITTVLTKISLLATLYTSTTFACSEAEAFNKMMAIGRVQQAMSIETQNDDKEKTLTKMLSNLNADMKIVNDKYMMSNNYSQACSEYDKIVTKYNIDMQKASKDMLTIEQLKEDGGKNGGSCSLSEASIRMMDTIEKMQKLMENGDIATEEFDEFNSKNNKISPLITTNPSKYCDELENLKKEYIKE